MNDPKADKAETKPLVKISNKVIEIEEYESVMRQSRKVLTRMDEVLDNSTNITPEETSDWKEFWKNLKDSSTKKTDIDLADPQEKKRGLNPHSRIGFMFPGFALGALLAVAAWVAYFGVSSLLFAFG